METRPELARAAWRLGWAEKVGAEASPREIAVLTGLDEGEIVRRAALAEARIAANTRPATNVNVNAKVAIVLAALAVGAVSGWGYRHSQTEEVVMAIATPPVAARPASFPVGLKYTEGSGGETRFILVSDADEVLRELRRYRGRPGRLNMISPSGTATLLPAAPDFTERAEEAADRMVRGGGSRPGFPTYKRPMGGDR